jgi:inorganic triphosphatase YgiF
MEAGQEIELKFELDAAALDRLEQRLTLRAGAPEPAPAKTLVSVYYDTPLRTLQKAGVTVRIREGDGRRVQTVKHETVTALARGEWETVLVGKTLNLKALAATPMGELLRAAAPDLRPVFTTRLQRTQRIITEAAGEIEAAMDRGEIEAEGRRAPVCELELELKSGRPQALFDLARRLSEAEPLRLSFQSKAERGYRLWADEAPKAFSGDTPRLTPDMTVGQAFAAIGWAGLRQLIANAETLRDARRPEAVHQMRVALRRLRTACTLFETAVGDPDRARLNGELKWLAGELDQPRDLDVFIADTFRPAADRFHDQQGLAGLGERLHAARGKAYDRAVAVLDAARYRALTLHFAAWLDGGAWTRGDRAAAPIGAFAADGLDRLRRQIKRRGADLKALDPAARHKVRIRAKRMRYALEFFAGLYGAQAGRRDRFLATLKTMQDALGELNDLEVARDKGLILAEGGGRAAGDSEAQGARQAFAAGLIIGARARSQKPLLKAAQRQYDKMMQAEPFWRG